LIGPCSAEEADWVTVESDGLTLKLPESDPSRGEELSKSLVSLRTEVAAKLGDVPIPGLEIYVARSEQDFRTLTHNRIPHWGIGVAYPQAMTMVLQYRAGQSAALLQTARHEFSHLLLHHAIVSAGNHVPTWFNEGVAMWVAKEWRIQQSLGVAVAAVRDGLVRLGAVDSVLTFDASRAHLAYDQSYLAVLFLINLAGEGAVEDVIADLRNGTSFDVALYRITGLSPSEFEAAFTAYVAGRFGFRSLLTSGEAIWFYIVLLVILVWVGVRVRTRATLARWEEEDPLDALPLKLRAKIKRERGL
jgi:hypothetical protein